MLCDSTSLYESKVLLGLSWWLSQSSLLAHPQFSVSTSFIETLFTRKPKTTLIWEKGGGCHHLSCQPLTHSILTLSFVATWLQKHLLSPPHTSIAWRLNLLVWIQDPPSALILVSPNFFFILLNIALGVLFGPYLHSQRTPLPLVWTSAPYLFCTVPLCFSLSSSPLLCIK